MARAEWEQGSLQTTGDQNARTSLLPGRLGLGRGGCQETLWFDLSQKRGRRGEDMEGSYLFSVQASARHSPEPWGQLSACLLPRGK